MSVERLDHRAIVGLDHAPRPTKMVVDVVSGDTITFKTDGAAIDTQEIRVTMIEKTGHRARLEVCAPRSVKILRNKT